jgi:glycosyltransferase involved in cell wall biosynthesis
MAEHDSTRRKSVGLSPHLLMIAQYFPPDSQGQSTRAYNAARSLTDRGCRVTVIAAFPHYPHGNIPKEYRKKIVSVEQNDGIKVIRTWVPAISHYTYLNRIIVHGSFVLSSLLGLFQTGKMDVIIAMNPNLFAFFPAFIFRLVYGRKILRNVDDLWPEVWYDLGIVRSRAFKKVLDWITKISYDVPVAITPVSHGYVPVLTNKYHIPLHKIFVIEHGVDTTRFHRIIGEKKLGEVEIENDEVEPSKDLSRNSTTTAGPARTASKEVVGINARIVYSGGLGIGYDFEPVIRAAKLLEGERVGFILRGAGTLAHDEDQIRNMINQLNVKNVELRTEWLSSKDLLEFLNSADIFVLPMSFITGTDKGLPTKILEYQALGKPIVCISNGEAADYVCRTRSGLVCRSRDPQKIAQLVMKLVDDKFLAQELGNNGLNFIQENLTLEKIGEQFMKIITTKFI